jgi:hypothetical protein
MTLLVMMPTMMGVRELDHFNVEDGGADEDAANATVTVDEAGSGSGSGDAVALLAGEVAATVVTWDNETGMAVGAGGEGGADDGEWTCDLASELKLLPLAPAPALGPRLTLCSWTLRTGVGSSTARTSGSRGCSRRL